MDSTKANGMETVGSCQSRSNCYTCRHSVDACSMREQPQQIHSIVARRSSLA